MTPLETWTLILACAVMAFTFRVGVRWPWPFVTLLVGLYALTAIAVVTR